jgi:glycine/D-amino acid oxidase-like deaminating enzyme
VSALLADAEVAVIGAGVMAGAVALELASGGRATVVVPEVTPPEIGHAASGPFVPYRDLARSLGREGAREIFLAFRESHARMRAFLALASADCGYRPNGAFLLAEDRAQGVALAESEDLLREDGFPGEFLDHYMLEARFDVAGFTGAYWAADDGEFDAWHLAAGLREAAGRRGAVAADTGPIRAIEEGPDGLLIRGDRRAVRAERAVVAADAVGRLAGLSLASAAEAEAAIESGAQLPGRARSVDGRFGFQAADRILRVQAAGTAADLDLLLPRLQASARTRSSGEAVRTPDGLPRIGPLAGSRLLLACGPESVGLAFAGACWLEEILRSGRDPTPRPLRAAPV